VAIGLTIFALAVFTSIGPMRAGWNDFANNGNGTGASASWLASQN
jgi:hypothetical protein